MFFGPVPRSEWQGRGEKPGENLPGSKYPYPHGKFKLGAVLMSFVRSDTIPQVYYGGLNRYQLFAVFIPGEVIMEENAVTMPVLLKKIVEMGGSDLHLTTSSPPRIRLDGDLIPLSKDKLEPDQVRSMIYSVMTDQQKFVYEEN